MCELPTGAFSKASQHNLEAPLTSAWLSVHKYGKSGMGREIGHRWNAHWCPLSGHFAFPTWWWPGRKVLIHSLSHLSAPSVSSVTCSHYLMHVFNLAGPLPQPWFLGSWLQNIMGGKSCHLRYKRWAASQTEKINKKCIPSNNQVACFRPQNYTLLVCVPETVHFLLIWGYFPKQH